MTIELDPSNVVGQFNAIAAYLLGVGRAQADLLGEGLAFAVAEANSLSLRGGTLGVSRDGAARGRRSRGLSWVCQRLIELAESDARVEVELVRLLGSGRAHGITRPDWEGFALPGREYRRLRGPVTHVTSTVATHRYPSPRRDRVEVRTPLGLGRTIVHELVVHAWRDISYYQPNNADDPRNQNFVPPGELSDAHHRDSPHADSAAEQAHNLADAESDLLDLYYDLEMRERDPSYPRGPDHASRYAQILGGVMGNRVLRWQTDTTSLRRQAAEIRRERLRFLEQRVQFAEEVRRAQAQDLRARRR